MKHTIINRKMNFMIIQLTPQPQNSHPNQIVFQFYSNYHKITLKYTIETIFPLIKII